MSLGFLWGEQLMEHLLYVFCIFVILCIPGEEEERCIAKRSD